MLFLHFLISFGKVGGGLYGGVSGMIAHEATANSIESGYTGLDDESKRVSGGD